MVYPGTIIPSFIPDKLQSSIEKAFKGFVCSEYLFCFYDFPVSFFIKCSDDTILLFSILLELTNEVSGIKISVHQRTAFNMIGYIWKARNISLKTKVQLFNSNVKTILLYGVETWKTTNSLLHKLKVFTNMSQAHPQHQMA